MSSPSQISPIQDSQAAKDYLARINAQFRSIFSASVVVESLGYEKETANIRFDRQGNVKAPGDLAPTDEEAKAIILEVSAMQFPHQVTLGALPNSGLPPIIKDAHSSDLYIFRTPKKQIRFIQVRVQLENGDKRYVPQTYWSDGLWRAAEPEDGLPIYNVDLAYKGARVFLHEGAKAARRAQELAEEGNHPWSSYLATGVHLGWIGGAHHLGRNRWSELTNAAGEVIIIPDNDFIGSYSVAKIAERFRCPTYFIQLDARWPKAWDVADPMPDSFFSSDNLYQGPELDDLMQCCNRATEELGEVRGRQVFAVREEFAANWVRIQNLRHYANLAKPEITLDKEQFNILVRPYSDVADTAALLAKVSGNICDKVTFMPNLPPGMVSVDGDLCLNQYIDRRIKPLKGGDTSAFWEFLDYLIPSPEERHQVVRWMATLYAKPEVRIGYGLLLLSKMHGVGKSALLDMIAALVGKRHTSFPGDAMVQSDFNGWVVNKRLVVVHEIYAGQNWKTYNRLKSLITDEYLEANNKHMVNYTLPNWSHYAAASNSLEALRIEHDDRRWYVPRLSNWLYHDYDGLYRFIKSGGLRYLARELLALDDFIKPGEHAPRTQAKSDLIEQSMPADERMVLMLCERLESGCCIDAKDIWLWLQSEIKGRAYVTPQRIGSLLTEQGYHVEPQRTIGSRDRRMVWKSTAERESVLSNVGAEEVDAKTLGRLREPAHTFSGDSTM